MKPIAPTIHGYVDYLTVVVFLAAPKLLGLDGLPALLSWTLAGVHLALTLVTDFPLGWRPWLPFWISGWVEQSLARPWFSSRSCPIFPAAA